MNSLAIFQEVYDAEVNYRVETFWDGGFYVSLGDEAGGFLEENMDFGSMVDAAEGLKVMVVKHYPGSDFAMKHRDDG